jgi:hypothetical protein
LGSDGFRPKGKGKGSEFFGMVQDQALLLYSGKGFLDPLNLELTLENFSLRLYEKKVVGFVFREDVEE